MYRARAQTRARERGRGRGRKGSQVWAVKLFATKIAAVLGIGTTTTTTISRASARARDNLWRPRHAHRPEHTKGKRQFIRRLSLSLGSSWRSSKGKAKQILAAFWLIANSSQSWLQIKQTVRRAMGVCYMLIIFNWFMGKECQRCFARFSVRFSVESAATAVASWSCLTLSRGKF